MTYWYFNTDKGKKYNPTPIWFQTGMAYSGGDRQDYGEPLKKLQPNDICFMYENRIGIVSVGRVIEQWDGKSHKDKNDKYVYKYDNYDMDEYRIKIEWLIDLRNKPVSFKQWFGYGPPERFLQTIIKHSDKAERLLINVLANQEFYQFDSLYEGELKKTEIDQYQRNLQVRRTCISYWGPNCFVCGFNFAEKYGPIGQDYIHIHHLTSLSLIRKEYKVDPVKDLRPICANCHAIIHKKIPPYTIEEMKHFLSETSYISNGNTN